MSTVSFNLQPNPHLVCMVDDAMQVQIDQAALLRRLLHV